MDEKKLEKLMKKIETGREYRKIELSGIEVREEENGAKIVEGYATTFNEPYTLCSFDGYTLREQVAPTAFEKTDMRDVIMQYDHEGRVFARISNGTLELFIDSHGLKIRANLGGTELGRQLYEEIKGGYTTKMSFGFTVKTSERVVTEDEETGQIDVLRTITGISKLYDVSAVSIPANDATEISARSLFDGEIEEIRQELADKAVAEKRKKILIARIKFEMEKNK